MEQKKKKSRKIVLKVVLYSIFFITCVNFGFGFFNYLHNKNVVMPTQAMQDGVIINQDLVNEYRLGVHWANKNSCGVIATYNFLKLNNKNADYAELLRFFDAYGTFAFGLLGTNPLTIQTILSFKGFDMGITCNVSEMEDLAKKSGVSILMYFHSRGAHFITLQYNESINMFKTYNENYGKVLNRKFSNLLNYGTRNNKFAILIYEEK